MAENDIFMASTMRSGTAMLHNKIFERFCNSRLLFKVTIAKKCKRTVTGEAMNQMTTKIQGKDELVRSQIKDGNCGQKNNSAILVEVELKWDVAESVAFISFFAFRFSWQRFENDL